MNSHLPILDRLVNPLSECLDKQSLKRILNLKADARLQSRVDSLAKKNSAGTITPEEKSEYSNYVSFANFVAILQSKARKQLAQSTGA